MSRPKVCSFFCMPALNKNIQIQLFESFCKKSQIDGKEIEATIGDKKLMLKVAATPQSQAKGFMHGEEPDETHGIIFIYEEPGDLSFWMKDVPFDLDIIFFDEECNYLSHQTMNAYNGERDHQLPRYECRDNARYAVEVCGGWFKKHGSKECKLNF
jgi:uncharacterized membrane protein (UPF0127 family)